uniref:Uncharacterized protein n=1 Tax=Rhizophora mucronata TaxID=61149 RepID=A0A2P2NIX2_RHIMU
MDLVAWILTSFMGNCSSYPAVNFSVLPFLSFG